ncbi:uncharacterized protein LOC120075810 [Benincasa hispida]|uniref:uncharacterized protein LOC120075810 n=1 Tax=Benincasa hispida TaxID=102211 RepID=UPI0018FF761C|nr:uncharacterized protein LOC120075810 [Benincasa hispida]
MAVPKLVSLTICLALIVFSAAADAIVDGGDDVIEVVREDGFDSSVLKIELEKLNSKIRELEVLIDEKARELERKDHLISQKDEIFRDKSDRVSFLESEIESLQREGKLHAVETIAKAHSRAAELEKQISELKKELDAQSRERSALEVRSNEAEKKMHKFISKLEKLQNTNEEQKRKIQKLERALKVAEEEMIKAKFEVTSRTEELMEVHGAWLPPWLASFWNEHLKPIINIVVQKAWMGKTHVENWLGPHVEPIKSKWIPAMQEQWLVVKTNSKPHLQSLCKRSSEAYEASKQALTPHIIRAQEFSYPYFQKVKMVSKPYVDHVATLMKPHVNKVQVALNPYTKEIVHAGGNLMQSATTHHQKVKSTIQEVLNSHDITRLVATKEFEWLLDLALLALPMLILFNLCSCCGISRKRARKSVRGANTNPVRRKAKKGTSGR